jgi:vacuolar-type H+-ATPase subunit E/Vma4
MEPYDNESRALISGIEQDAQQEAEKILKEAKKRAAELRKYTEKQIESILREAEEKARTQSGAIKNKVLSGVEIEVKRKSLYLKEKMFAEVLGRVKEEFKKLIPLPSYRTVLLNWIVEAAVGLGADEAIVSTSKNEEHLIDETLLRRAEKQVKEISGRGVKLRRSQNSGGTQQGIIITASNRRMAFNNQVATRLLRYQREIRNLIYSQLFGE